MKKDRTKKQRRNKLIKNISSLLFGDINIDNLFAIAISVSVGSVMVPFSQLYIDASIKLFEKSILATYFPKIAGLIGLLFGISFMVMTTFGLIMFSLIFLRIIYGYFFIDLAKIIENRLKKKK